MVNIYQNFKYLSLELLWKLHKKRFPDLEIQIGNILESSLALILT